MKVRLAILVSFFMAAFFLTASAIAGSGTYLYVGNTDNSKISVINTGTNEVTHTISYHVYAPQKIFVSPNGQFAYYITTGTYGNKIWRIDTATNSVTNNLFGGGRIIEFTPDSGKALIAMTTGWLNLLDTGASSLDYSWEFGSSRPYYISINPNGKFAYGDAYYNRDSSIRIVNIDTKASSYVGLPAPTDFGYSYSYHNVRGMAQEPEGRYLYVTSACWTQNDWCQHCDSGNYGFLHKFDMQTHQLLKTLPVEHNHLGEIAITPDGRYACVVDWHYNDFFIFDLRDDSHRKIAMGEKFQNIIISPDSKYAYFIKIDSDRVAALDLDTAQEVVSIPVGDIPYQMVLSPDGKALYVTNTGSNSVSVIDIEINQVVYTIPVGLGPRPIAFIPPQNTPATVNAGEDLAIYSQDQLNTVIEGTASDIEHDQMTYRWLDGETQLTQPAPVSEDGKVYLNLSSIGLLSVGEHTLVLEVDDGQEIARDEMVLNVMNSPVYCVPAGGGVFEIGSRVVLGGEVSDFDGDMLSYEWSVDGNIQLEGTIQALQGGGAVTLPEHYLDNLSLGMHTIILTIADGQNGAARGSITVEVNDSGKPTLSPVVDKGILWPPNHKMVDVLISANASDNSGLPVSISVQVQSNESEDWLDDGDMAPDWLVQQIDPASGAILLQLRAERSGTGDGRIYTVAVTAQDTSGNTSTVPVEIIVPHSQANK